MLQQCLLCFTEFTSPLTWEEFVLGSNRNEVCMQCAQHFKRIKGSNCTICSKPNVTDLCHDCREWSLYYSGNEPLSKNISLYEYNEAMQQFITRWKYRGDYVIGNIFKNSFIKMYNHHFSEIEKDISIVPIPLSNERLQERRFNQALMLAHFLSSQVDEALQRIHNEKQAKKSKRERMITKNPFKLMKNVNKTVVLVDDIYTTGRTIRHAAELLKQNGCETVFSLTLVRG